MMVTHRGMRQAYVVEPDAQGRPTVVSFLRWSNANDPQKFRLQPFWGTLSAFRDDGGFMLPSRISAGNHVGTPGYFPFFKAEVADVRFVRRAQDARRCQG